MSSDAKELLIGMIIVLSIVLLALAYPNFFLEVQKKFWGVSGLFKLENQPNKEKGR